MAERIRYFELRDGKSSKFWEMTWEGGRSFTVRYGKIGAAGQTSTKSFASAEQARAAANKLMIAKHGKGYAYVPAAPEEARTAVPGVRKIFADYDGWYRSSYDFAEEDDAGPLEGLTPLSQDQLARLEADFGVLPRSYRDLVLHLGVGTLLIATDGEPVAFTILPPEHIPRVKKDCLGCIDPDLLRAARSRQGIDGSRLLPILVDRDWNQWALLTNQSDGDDRVVLFSHEQEQREDRDLFAHQGSVEDYFAELFAGARKLYSPWYLWTGWKH